LLPLEKTAARTNSPEPGLATISPPSVSSNDDLGDKLMDIQKFNGNRRLQLKAGELVQVRSREEIMATLDENGRFENVPFMPEMLQHAGQTLRVWKRADKTCDPANEPWSIRRLTDTVHLEGVRCDGSAHGGCQAGCLIFWKESWLRRAEPGYLPLNDVCPSQTSSEERQGFGAVNKVLTSVSRQTPEGETVYSCQATEVRRFTTPMSAWDPRQYIRDLRSGNLDSGLTKNSIRGRTVDMFLAVIRLIRSLGITILARGSYPYIVGGLDKTPNETLNLQPGELVQIRSREEIEATLDKARRNRGLMFDTEMVPYCGGIFRVLRSVHKFVDEKSGKMLNTKAPCIILEGVFCRSDFHRLCPRAIPSYWREIWLRRASEPSPQTMREPAEICERVTFG
jgi:hypothetical protein